MKLIIKLIGLALILTGIYFLGQNIVFTTQTAPYWWRDIPATGSVVAILGGIMVLMFGGSGIRQTGWILVGAGIVMVFLSGGVVLQPTSLWTFFLSFIALVGGWKLVSSGRIDF